MRIQENISYRHIVADEGKMLMNGDVITNEVYLPLYRDYLEWKEISEAIVLSTEEVLEQITNLTDKVNELESNWNNADALKLRLDELGKLVQTDEGDGSDFNPFKWVDGMEVVKDKWYKTPSNYIWMAVNTGIPSNELDENYFDVIK